MDSISGVPYHDENVYDGLGGQPRNKSRAYMLNPQGGRAERFHDSPSVRLELLRPIRIVVEELDFGFFDASNQPCLQRLTCHNISFPAHGKLNHFLE